jgi:imidazolonepropionase-like amidohydrolase
VALPDGSARIDLTGKTVMPALIDAHVHLGYRKGLDFSPSNYTRENVTDGIAPANVELGGAALLALSR